MTLRQLKKMVNSLSDEDLNSELMYNSDRLCISGKVEKVIKAKADLYYNGEDDPAELYTKSQLKAQGCENEEIKLMSIEVKKGSFYILF